ncbi:MAG: cytochrome c oxidase subunit 3, partial [Planctomycetota bacterium]|nr:cytochrome c oxidase subunit 3 [Planctomycetota bacterium]
MSNQAPSVATAAPAHGGHDDAHHDPNLAHHFDTPKQQFDAAKMGMWFFLATEVLMFGGLFVGYSVWRANHPEVFLYAHTKLVPFYGCINTVFLISSSFTMAWGVRAAQLGKTNWLRLMLILTILGGCCFLVVKTIEYNEKIQHQLWVGPWNQFHPKFTGTVHADSHAEGAGHVSHEAGGPDHTATPGHDSAAPAVEAHDVAHAVEGAHETAAAPAHAEAAAPAAAAPAAPAPEHSAILPPKAGPSGLTPDFAKARDLGYYPSVPER